MALTQDQIKKVKAEGFLLNRGTEEFSGRILTGNGVIQADQLKLACEAAEKFGNGTLAMTARLTIELPGIAYDNIVPFQEFIAAKGLKTGGTGAKVRPVVACKGTTCVFGLYDTQKMAMEIHRRFYEGYGNVKLPHKFKIAVGGCPNNCMKPDLNDIGIIGQLPPSLKDERCRGCGKCTIQAVCPVNAVSMEGDKLKINEEKCTRCGRCVTKCPFEAVHSEHTLYQIYLGGRWGKEMRRGTPLSRLLTEKEVLPMVEKTILLFKKEGKQGERFASTIKRLGMEQVEKVLLSDELLEKKESILGATIQ